MNDLYEKMDSKNTALLVIDVINSCTHKKCEQPELNISFSKIRDMVPRLRDFVDEYRKNIGGLVVFTNTVPWKKEYLTENINKLYTDPKTTYYSKDNTGFAEQFYMIEPKEEDIVITKNTYDAFANTKLDQELKANTIKYLVVAGIFGDGCVLATICGGFAKGYNFVMLEDLIETTDVQIRQELLARLKQYTLPVMYGKIISSENFLEAWSKIKLN